MSKGKTEDLQTTLDLVSKVLRKEVLKNVRSEQLLTLVIYSQIYSVSQRKLVGILEQKVATRYR